MIKITITEQEILNLPNNFDLGEEIRNRFWLEADKVITKNSQNSGLSGKLTKDSGRVNSISKKDECVICGKKSPYFRDTHIDRRVGYIEGAGQGCFQPGECHSSKI